MGSRLRSLAVAFADTQPTAVANAGDHHVVRVLISASVLWDDLIGPVLVGIGGALVRHRSQLPRMGNVPTALLSATRASTRRSA
ncbi:MAG: hypothetical protein IPN78_16605 [Candidatus Accumulibacter sp.]|nr:hypothetical protein [Candidatus Accumulibacter propinquus]